MPVFVVSEGSRDTGDFDPDGREGCVRILTRRLLEESQGKPIEPSRFVRGKWARVQKTGMKSTDGFRVKLAMTIAVHQAKPDCEGLAVVVDRDKKRHADRLTELQAGRDEARNNGNLLADRTAIGLAIEEVEAWLLGAHELLHNHLGIKKPVKEPESLSKPKERFYKDLKEQGHDPSDCYDRIAQEASLQNIRDKCPSFRDYATDVVARLQIDP